MIRTRIAPSPTGMFHIGTLRTALFNWLYANCNNGEFILRIDDTDADRNKDEYVDYIYKVMSDYGLNYDITFKQSERLDRYKQIALLIGTETESGIVCKMQGEKNNEKVEYDMVLVRPDGNPTYNFASVVDDYDYDITHIIRGVDHISNLDRQIQLWNKISSVIEHKPFPEVIHLGLLFEKGKKISKRDNTGNLSHYQSFDKRAVLNWIMRLGWSHPNATFDKDYPTLSIDQMKELFMFGNMQKQSCNIDINKLNNLNKKWINKPS